MSADQPDKPPVPDPGYPCQSYNPSLGGVPRDTVVWCAGVCLGLALTTRYPFSEEERETLRTASKALSRAALRLNMHTGDCTIYSALINQRPTDGICTCGYGRALFVEGDPSQMFSPERAAIIGTRGV